jgi:murein L,D-transpeptidase YcbB/YkuD
VACGWRSSKPSGEQIRAIRAKVESQVRPEYVAQGTEGVRLWNTLKSFYAARGYQPAWIGRHFARPQLDHLVKAIEKAEQSGLDPADYSLPEIVTRQAELSRDAGGIQRDPVRLVEMDIWLTYSFLRYASHLLNGRFDPNELGPNWSATPSKKDLANLLETSLAQNVVEQVPEHLAPRHSQYAALQRALARYREIAAAGTWASIPETKALKRGGQHPSLRIIRRNLALVEDLSGADDVLKQNDGNPAFDEVLEQAVRKFEARHGLKIDGVIDPEFILAMNVSPDERVRQIELNLERLRWLPESLGDNHLSINIPAFELAAMEEGKSVLTMRVIVGKSENPTPVFSDRLTHVVFSPYWNIPDTIAIKETIPAIQKDPEYLAKNQIDVIRGSGPDAEPLDPATIDWSVAATDKSYKFRQRPGPDNSLGHVKFLFPNKFDVYLHDTPADSLFQRIERDFSHGCIRLEQPMELAQYVLRNQPEWTAEKIQTAMHAGEEKHVSLKEPLPVHIQYLTAWVDKNGSVQFRPDIYGHDQQHVNLLANVSKLRRAAKGGE